MLQRIYHHYIKKKNVFKYDTLCVKFWYLMKLKYSTIYALSSGQGKCGIAVIRVSGDQARQSILKMTSSETLPPPRKAVLRTIINPLSREVLDKGLVLWFPAPKSFTGEDSVEFHIHGSPAVCKAVLSALGKMPNFTPAEPGDLTKRAFYNSKLDLTSVEGLGDLIHAETEAQRKQAFRQMEGSLREIYTEWKELILKSRANVEAYIDFSEDDNIERDVLLDVRRSLERLSKEISKHLTDSRRGERLRSGLNLVILGRPNVGKSSFLNAVVRRPAAIVSPIAGTTRDVVKVSLDMGGYPVNISDTAGLRSTEDIIEKEGISRALDQVKNADIALVIVDAVEIVSSIKRNRKPFDLELFMENYYWEVGILPSFSLDISATHKYEWLINKNYVVLINKVDLLQSEIKMGLSKEIEECANICLTSLKTLEGLDLALQKMKDLCVDLCGSGALAESPYLTSQRQRTHIEECLKHIQSILGLPREVSHTPDCENEEDPGNSDDEFNASSIDLLCQEESLVLAAQRLQLASNQLGYITGQITTEDVLDHIFSSFCIGK